MADIFVKTTASGGANGSTWADAYTTINAGMAAWGSGDVVRVCEGTHATGLVMADGVVVFGGYPDTLTGTDLTGRDPETYPSTIDGSGTNQGFTTDEDGTIDGLKFQDCYATSGGVLYCDKTILFRNCAFNGNESTNGGCFYLTGGGYLTFEDCTFANNITTLAITGRGACFNVSNSSSSVTLTRCSFDNNSAHEAGVLYSNQGAPITATDVALSGNESWGSTRSGGAFYISGTASILSVTNCFFDDNTSTYKGGAIRVNGADSVELISCVFSNNDSTHDGGALEINTTATCEIMNCTFTGNTSAEGGAMYLGTFGTSCTITNAILTGNTASSSEDEIYVNDTTPTITYSYVYGGFTGTGNIDETDGAIAFVGTGDDPYAIQVSSPCVDAGTDTGAPTTDILGNARVSTTDIGAYEYGGEAPSSPDDNALLFGTGF